jgi:hypothetical protein
LEIQIQQFGNPKTTHLNGDFSNLDYGWAISGFEMVKANHQRIVK